MTEPVACSENECRRPRHARGWCIGHYARWRKTGTPGGPLATRYATPEEAFLARVEQDGDCLVWTGSRKASGHGEIQVGGRRIGTHRYAYAREHGPIPEGLMVDHICHNPPCVRVEHLRLATAGENNRNRSGPAANNTSGYRGVTFQAGKWVAQIGGQYGGRFDTPEEAAVRAAEMTREQFGEFAGRSGLEAKA